MRLGRDRHAIQSKSGRADFCLIFMHIPKTAGTTLVSTLQLNYPPQTTLHLNLLGRPIQEMERFPPQTLSSLSLIHGHVPYGIHRYVQRPCGYITLLREPVARVVSAYKHILTRPHHELHDRVVGDRIGLEEFIDSFWVDKRISRQTRQLCDRHDAPLDSGAVAEAKRNLEGFLVVGLTERFEETFALLRRVLRLRLPLYVTRNVGRPVTVSERAVELIRERERYDLELYHFARDLFADHVARQGASFPVEVSAYRAMRPIARLAGTGRTAELLGKLSHARAARNQAH